MNKQYCECGAEAKYVSKKTKKWRCCLQNAQCPANKEKNRLAQEKLKSEEYRQFQIEVVRKSKDEKYGAKQYYDRVCIQCGNSFQVFIRPSQIENFAKGDKKCCSNKCARTFASNFNRKETNKKLSIIAKRTNSIRYVFSKSEIKLKTICELDYRKCKICETVFVTNQKSKKQTCSKKCSNKLTGINVKGKTGGLKEGSSRGKHGWYKGYWCDSSWELAFVIYNLEHGIPFERNRKKFPYVFENKQHNYYPDFLLNDGYYEVKAVIDERSKEKFKQFPEKITIVDKQSIQPYLNYVIEKYGKKFISLYE